MDRNGVSVSQILVICRMKLVLILLTSIQFRVSNEDIRESK